MSSPQLERLDAHAQPSDLRRLYPDHWERYEFSADRVYGRVLDVACGPGFGTMVLAARAQVVVTGADIDQGTLGAARRQFHDRAQFVSVPATGRWSFVDETFDTVVSLETIEHAIDPEGFLSEIARVMRPTGRLIMSTPLLPTPSATPPSNPYHLREYTWDELGVLLSKQFEIHERWTQVSRAGATWHRATTSSVGGILKAAKRLLPTSLRTQLRRGFVAASGGACGAIHVGQHSAGSVQIVIAGRLRSPDSVDLNAPSSSRLQPAGASQL